MAKEYTEKQGQYLAYIYYYTKVNGSAPSHADIQRYFGVTPPTVHQMLLTLNEKSLITKQPNVARSIQVTLKPDELPIHW